MRKVLPACPPAIANKLPGKVRAHRREAVAPSLQTQLADEAEGRDNAVDPAFFDALAQQPLIEYDWPGWYGPPNRFPMVYSDVGMVAASFSVPLQQLRPLLPATSRLTPARVTPWHGLLMVMAYHVHRSGLGRYQQLAIATPMFLDTPRRLPAWPLLRESLRSGSDPALGLHILELPVDRQRPCEAAQRMYGHPSMVAHAEFALGSQTGLASMEAEGQRLAALEVSAPRTYLPLRMDLSFQTFSILGGHLVRTRHAALAEGYRGGRGNAKVAFGDHPRFARFRALQLMPRPLETRVCTRLNWIVGGPEDLGTA
ncbi:MAG TPA: hypothetical protein VLI06_18325 [Solimonas sp.]|nr:hypothetical protein [Solimonas sp.]